MRNTVRRAPLVASVAPKRHPGPFVQFRLDFAAEETDAYPVTSWLYIAFGTIHLVLGLSVFGFVTWMMLGKDEDDAEGTDGGGGGGGGLHPRPWRPGPGRPHLRRGPVRIPEVSRPRGPAVRTAKQPR